MSIRIPFKVLKYILLVFRHKIFLTVVGTTDIIITTNTTITAVEIVLPVIQVLKDEKTIGFNVDT